MKKDLEKLFEDVHLEDKEFIIKNVSKLMDEYLDKVNDMIKENISEIDDISNYADSGGYLGCSEEYYDSKMQEKKLRKEFVNDLKCIFKIE